MRQDIEFRSRDVTLRGWFYKPEGEGPFPVCIVSHGWSCTKEQTLDVVAEHMVKAGVAALVYDQRNLGDSDGPMRGHIDPWEQIHDARAAISYAETIDGIDPQRIGIWGTSYSGAHAIVVAAVDSRIKAGSAQVPMLAGLANIQRLAETMNGWKPFIEMLNEERRRWARGEEPAMIAVCSDDPATPHAFPGLRTHAFFHAWGDRAGKWKNECTVRSLDLCLEYDPTPYLENLGTTPFQFVVGEDDMTTPADIAIAGYARIKGPKELKLIPGDHYTSYIEYIDVAASSAADFMARQLNRDMWHPQ